MKYKQHRNTKDKVEPERIPVKCETSGRQERIRSIVHFKIIVLG